MVALICLGICLIFVSGVVVLIFPSAGFVFDKAGDLFNFLGAGLIFAAVGTVGFVIGIVVGKRHPNKMQKWYGAIFIGGIPMMCFSWMLYSYAIRVEVPQKLKLADYTNGIKPIHFELPKGRYHRIIFESPAGSTNQFSCHIKFFSDARIVTNLTLNPIAPSAECNFINRQMNYDVEITFDQLPPPSSSLWLYWLQTRKDKN
jgi:hypothetical protein